MILTHLDPFFKRTPGVPYDLTPGVVSVDGGDTAVLFYNNLCLLYNYGNWVGLPHHLGVAPIHAECSQHAPPPLYPKTHKPPTP